MSEDDFLQGFIEGVGRMRNAAANKLARRAAELKPHSAAHMAFRLAEIDVKLINVPEPLFAPREAGAE